MKEGYLSDKCLWAHSILPLPENVIRHNIPHYAGDYYKVDLGAQPDPQPVSLLYAGRWAVTAAALLIAHGNFMPSTIHMYFL